MLEPNLARTKIIATLGPSCGKQSQMEAMILAGVDAFRFNMSHGDDATRRKWVASVKRARRKLARPVSMICDLRGPRIRMGRLDDDVELTVGEKLTLKVGKSMSKDGFLPVDYRAFVKDVSKGDRVLLRDGRAELVVLSKTDKLVQCRIDRGCTLSSNQGVNLPDSSVSAPALSAKDRADIAFAVEMKMDWVALSFVRTAKDIKTLQRAIAKQGGDIPIIAKIEHPEAVDNLDAILEATDAAMVARGDLAVEMGHEVVPTIQKRIVRRAIAASTPVIVATQMLESMMSAAQPTRAEVSDVANAVVDGVDAVMLSGETAVGEYALEACQLMHRIASRTESELFTENWRLKPSVNRLGLPGSTITLSIVNAAIQATHQANAQLILAFTESGRTPCLVSSFRAQVPIIAVTSRRATFHRLALLWGVRPAVIKRSRGFADRNRAAHLLLKESGLLKLDDLLTVLTGSFQVSGTTRTLRL
ncbi:MAG: pyruvate kinase, partial [Planctomycetes bacterium]|nr:pyruvate kinase [Planctomycetota bacterium]